MFHSHEIKVRFYELDPYNHLNHAAYVQYFEVARIELLESIGYGVPQLAALGFHIVVTRIETRFLTPAHSGDVVTVDTEVAEIRRATAQFRQRMCRGADVLASQVVDAAFTKTNGRPTRIPEGFATAIAVHRSDELTQ